MTDWIKENPLLSVGGAAVLGVGGTLLLSGDDDGKKGTSQSGSSSTGATIEAREEAMHQKMVSICIGKMNTVECSKHFTQVCVSEEGKSKEGCSDFNQSFCGSSGSLSTDPSFPGLRMNVQYCTLTHARSDCSTTSSSPSCQWIKGIQSSTSCQSQPLQGTCLPTFRSLHEMSAICANHPQDPVCYRSQSGQPKFIVGINPSVEIPSAITSQDSTRSLASQSLQMSSENSRSFTSLSPLREACYKGEMYDCE